MRIFIAAIAAIPLLAGCAVSISGGEHASSSERAPHGLIDPPAVTRPLTDLARGVKGKVLLHHVDGEGQNTGWSTKLKMGTSFRLSMDCVEASGVMTVLIDQSRLPHQCSTGPGNIRVGMIPDELAVRTIKVKVPKGAKWAILISKPPQS
ncbi:hypothetical protein [Nonomuraea sediminis]|uniref:hypothetical protein n=1 Tax=Nonomuraea sediminis TaxID=2835864 RepID=UPI001BDD912F|nr:hypothetical protein [Nonomuraea sediminis]